METNNWVKELNTAFEQDLTQEEWENLEEIYMDSFLSTSIPESIRNLKNLKSIVLGESFNLESIPDSIGELKNLESLSINNTTNPISIPDSIGELKNLDSLGLVNILYEIPAFIQDLPNLRLLDLSGNDNITYIPDWLGDLQKLISVNLSFNENLKYLPESLGKIPSLKRLDLEDSKQLIAIPESFRNIPKLVVENVESIIVPNSLTNKFPKFKYSYDEIKNQELFEAVLSPDALIWVDDYFKRNPDVDFNSEIVDNETSLDIAMIIGNKELVDLLFRLAGSQKKELEINPDILQKTSTEIQNLFSEVETERQLSEQFLKRRGYQTIFTEFCSNLQSDFGSKELKAILQILGISTQVQTPDLTFRDMTKSEMCGVIGDILSKF